MCEHPALLSMSPVCVCVYTHVCVCVFYMSESFVCVSVCALSCLVLWTALQISHLLPVTKYDTKINIID